MRIIWKRILAGIVFFLLTSILLFTVVYGYIGPSNQVESYNAFPGVDFDQPSGFYMTPDSQFNFVIEKEGKVKVFANNPDVETEYTLLDITNRVFSSIEDGMLSMAFHPDFNTNGVFYLYYSENHDTRYDISREDCDELVGEENFCISSVLSEFRVQDPSNPIDLVPNSEKVIMEFNQTRPFHRGGQLIFDDQDMLFFQFGDGQQENQVQNMTSLYGKILRIDIDNPSGGKQYGIPTDNPYYNHPNVSGEIYAYGFRNPWRGSIDPVTGNYWVGDVGKDYFEEINLIEPMKNYGWPVYEGDICKNNVPECFLANTTSAVLSYPHPSNIPLSTSQDDPSGVAVIGGHVYHGSEVEELQDYYIFADYTGSMYKLDLLDDGSVETEFIHKTPDLISHIGLGNDQELYIVAIYKGSILKLRQTYLLTFFLALIIYGTSSYFLLRTMFPNLLKRSEITEDLS